MPFFNSASMLLNFLMVSASNVAYVLPDTYRPHLYETVFVFAFCFCFFFFFLAYFVFFLSKVQPHGVASLLLNFLLISAW